MTDDAPNVTTPRAEGIDISGANGLWNFQPFHGEDFMFFRATSWDGDSLDLDNQFSRNWDQARLAEIPVRGAYHEIRPAVSSPFDQAQALTTIAQDHGMTPEDMLICAIDTPYSEELTPDQFGHWAHQFQTCVNKMAKGHRAIVYTDVSNGDSPRCEELFPWRLWIAEYDVQAPTVPRPWASRGLTWTFWQTQGTVAPDRNVCRFHRADLIKFARKELG